MFRTRVIKHSVIFFIVLSMALSAVAEEYNSEAANTNVELGLAYLHKGLYPDSKNRLLIALQENPKAASSWYSMGYYLEKTGNSVAAEKYYQKAISVEPHSGEAKNNYGTFLCREKRYNIAIAQFMAAIHEPNYLYAAKAYENAGLCAMKIPNYSLAVQYFHRALNENPGMPVTMLNLAKAEAKSGHMKEATRDFSYFEKLVAADESSEAIASYKRYVFSR